MYRSFRVTLSENRCQESMLSEKYMLIMSLNSCIYSHKYTQIRGHNILISQFANLHLLNTLFCILLLPLFTFLFHCAIASLESGLLNTIVQLLQIHIVSNLLCHLHYQLQCIES